MCGISAIYILDKKGRVMISRHFRPDLHSTIYDVFNKKVLQFDEYTLKPIILDKDGNLFYSRKHNDINVVAISRKNNNAVMVFAFINTFIAALEAYFKTAVEESIRDNFVIIYELLDEMMDNGYPQITDTKLLKTFIKSDAYEYQDNSHLKFAESSTQVVSWRREGIKYSKNEFFLDVVEKLSMLIGPSNNIIKSEIIGVINANCQLSGMPDLRLGLNDKAYYEAQGRTTRNRAVDFNDIRFHQCVRLGRFESERLVTFIPPDGEFELMSYRLDIRVKPLFSVDVKIENTSSTSIRFSVTVKSNYKERSIANNVDVFVPVPEDVESPSFSTTTGTATYVPEKNALRWSIKQFSGHRDYSLTASFKLPTIESSRRNLYRKQPINVRFEIPFFTVSGFQVRYLKIVDKSGYRASPWVKYLTKNGDYEIRME